MSKMYVAYDSRASYQDTDDCSILVATDSKKEARGVCKMYGGGVIYSYDDKNGELINETHVETVN